MKISTIAAGHSLAAALCAEAVARHGAICPLIWDDACDLMFHRGMVDQDELILSDILSDDASQVCACTGNDVEVCRARSPELRPPYCRLELRD